MILVAGVNGVGKTTSIAKLAKLLDHKGKKVVLAAGDTFRAAAVEQLTIWSQRLGCEIVTSRAARPGERRLSRGCARAHRNRGRRVHRRYGRPAPDAAEPDEAAHQDPARDLATRSPTRRTKCCWCSTPRPARTASARRSIFTKR